MTTFGHTVRRLSTGSDGVATLAAIDLDDASDLASGLAAIVAATPVPGPGGDILVVSDGAYTGSDPLRLVSELRAAGIRVHHLPVVDEGGADSGILSVDMAGTARLGQPVALGVTVHAATGGPAALRVHGWNEGGGQWTN